MEHVFKVTIGTEVKEYPKGTTYADIAAEYKDRYEYPIALAVRNGKIRELFKKVDRDCTLEFLTLADDAGHKTYTRTATLILMKAIEEVLGHEKVGTAKVEFTIGNGYFCPVKYDYTLTQDDVDKVNSKMQEYVDRDILVMKKPMNLEEAKDIFRAQDMEDKVKLFRYRDNSTVNIYELDGYYDYYYGYMLPSTGYVKYFDLQLYENGFVLVLPNEKKPTVVEPFEPLAKLFQTLQISSDWGSKLGIDTVADLNDQIRAGNVNDVILVQEALQERRIAEIASDIVSRDGVKFVMIAG